MHSTLAVNRRGVEFGNRVETAGKASGNKNSRGNVLKESAVTGFSFLFIFLSFDSRENYLSSRSKRFIIGGAEEKYFSTSWSLARRVTRLSRLGYIRYAAGGGGYESIKCRVVRRA